MINKRFKKALMFSSIVVPLTAIVPVIACQDKNGLTNSFSSGKLSYQLEDKPKGFVLWIENSSSYSSIKSKFDEVHSFKGFYQVDHLLRVGSTFKFHTYDSAKDKVKETKIEVLKTSAHIGNNEPDYITYPSIDSIKIYEEGSKPVTKDIRIDQIETKYLPVDSSYDFNDGGYTPDPISPISHWMHVKLYGDSIIAPIINKGNSNENTYKTFLTYVTNHHVTDSLKEIRDFTDMSTLNLVAKIGGY